MFKKMSDLIATNIRIEREKLKALKLKAVEENKSISQLIREAVDKVFLEGQKGENRPKKRIKNDPFFKIIGMYANGIKDGSINHDRYIYKTSKKR